MAGGNRGPIRVRRIAGSTTVPHADFALLDFRNRVRIGEGGTGSNRSRLRCHLLWLQLIY